MIQILKLYYDAYIKPIVR